MSLTEVDWSLKKSSRDDAKANCLVGKNRSVFLLKAKK